MFSINEVSQSKIARLWPITLLRVYTGIFFLKYGFGKITKPDFAKGLTSFVNGNLENCFGFMRPFLETVVLNNSGVFAFLVAWGEVLIGISLIIGLATRYASIAGALMLAAFWFTKGQGFLDGQNHDSIWFMSFIVLAGVHAGRQHSLDEKFKDRFGFLA